MQLVGSHLLIGGYFAHVDGQLRFGLASVNATTGAVDNYLTMRLSGHHNYITNGGAVQGQVGAIEHGRLAGRFADDGDRQLHHRLQRRVRQDHGYARDQILRVNLGTTRDRRSRLGDASFHQTCNKHAFDSYVSQVAWSPDGSFFVVVDDGRLHAGSHQLCDSASRFNASSTGLNVAAGVEASGPAPTRCTPSRSPRRRSTSVATSAG